MRTARHAAHPHPPAVYPRHLRGPGGSHAPPGPTADPAAHVRTYLLVCAHLSAASTAAQGREAAARAGLHEHAGRSIGLREPRCRLSTRLPLHSSASPLVCLSTRLPLHWSLPSSAHRSGLRARPHAVPAARHCLAAGARLGRRAGSDGAPRRRIGWRGASHDGGWGGSGRHLDQHAVAVADQGEAPVKHVRVGDVELLLRHPDIRVLQRQQRLPPPRPSLQPATRSAS
jgi:hypothetical protein